MYNDSGCKTDVRKVNASQRRKYKFKVTHTDSTDIVQSIVCIGASYTQNTAYCTINVNIRHLIVVRWNGVKKR